ncbi:MAG: DNA polymerase III subunit beta [Planctomycetota bacterium]|nr:MAG: DNA polymerase III subunit beta [Planctomycetota bacterium]
MHVIVNRNAMLDVLHVAAGIAASRTTRDVLKCIRLTTVDGILMVSATDLEVALQVGIRQVEQKARGDVLVPADKLMQIVRESTDETLALQAEEQVCHIQGRDSHFEVYGQDPKEFPPIPASEGEPDIEIDSGVLSDLVEKTVFAAAKENTRYAINGLLWEKKGKKLCLVATDGRRLAHAQGAVEKAVGEDQQVIVPVKTVSVLQRVLAAAEGKVMARFTSNQVLVESGDYLLSSALIEGQFPNYQEVIPQDNDKRVELDTDTLISAVKRAALLTNEQSRGVRLSFDKDKLVLSSRAPEQGEATISLNINYVEEPIEIGFNPVFLTDALRVAGTPTVFMELKENNRPGTIKAGSNFLYVIMPVNL